MITIILTIEGESIEKQLPTDWNDISWNTFVELQELPNSTLAYFAYFTNADENDLILIDNSKLYDFLSILEFLLNPKELIGKRNHPTINLQAEAWSKLEYAKQAYQLSDQNFFEAAPAMCEVYTRGKKGRGMDITKLSMPEAFPLAEHIFNQFVSFFEMFSELNEDELTAEQADAQIMADGRMFYEGIEVMLNLRSLSPNPLDHQKLMKLPALTIYHNKLAMHRVAGVDKRYQKIINAPKS
jgi:hypothetical protein